MNFLRNNFTFLPGTPAIFEEWQKIALAYEVRSAKVHDARLVAVMVVYGIDGVLTHNTQDFKRYLHIQAVHPDELPALLRAEGAASSPNGTGNG